jgi:hypothetical protein
MGPVVALLLIVAFFARRSVQQRDQLQDFCRRFGHQTAVIDNRCGPSAAENRTADRCRLFIDGGLVNYNPLTQNPLNYTSMPPD